jgi:3',5'-cyclic AMP phosphodiesterase CpdA
MKLTRRALLQAGLGAAVGSTAEAQPDTPTFTFVHITDTHIQPELGARAGVNKAFAAIRDLRPRPAFALIGGDLVMDAARVERRRADALFDLWAEAAARLEIPVYYSIGNHDLFDTRVPHRHPEDPDFGKTMWQRRLGLARRFASFDYQGWRFVTLDSCGILPDGRWEGVLDDEQLRWLDDLLRKTPRAMPLVFLTHFPLLTLFGQYTKGTTSALDAGMVVRNGKTFHEMIQRHRVRAVFQGHTHVVEECTYLGTHYITGGSVCGDWWKGPRLRVHPEGFVVASVRGDELSWLYQPYGWKARG